MPFAILTESLHLLFLMRFIAAPLSLISTLRYPPILAALLLGLAANVGVIIAQATVEPILIKGPRENRVNLVFLSEGYTAQELGQFPSDVEQMLQYLMSWEPFSEYESYFNAFAVLVASNESGADHPSREIFRDTYFNSSYDSWGLSRGLTVPPNDHNPLHSEGFGKAESILQVLLPEYDIIIFIVNDAGFGGWGDFQGVVTSLHSYGPEVLVHELGHAFAGLGDEYTTPFPEDPYPVVEEPNTTQEMNREKIKWRAWISDDTPIPTPETGEYDDEIGLFEGARYEPTGWYRPKRQCKMRGAFEGFCEVCTEQIIRSIYEEVHPIASLLPDAESLILKGTEWLLLNVTTMQPTAHDLIVRWHVNGLPQDGAVSTVFNTSALALGNGTHTIEVEVSDGTSRVRSDPEQLLTQNLSWQVAVSGVSTDTMARLYFPFYQEEGSSFTGFGFSNLSNQGAFLRLTALTDKGLTVPSLVNPARRTIPAKGQIAETGRGLFGLDSPHVQRGWVILESDNTDIGALFLTGDRGSLDGAGASVQASNVLYFSEAHEGPDAFRGVPAVTYLSLANPQQEVASTVELTLFSRSGEIRTLVEVLLPPMGMIYRSLKELFGERGLTSGGYVVAEVIEGGGIVGFELLDLPDHNSVVGLSPFNIDGSQHFATLFVTGQLSEKDGLFTAAKLINFSKETRRVELSAISESGISVGSPAIVELLPGEVLARDLGELLQLDGGSDSFIRGMLQVDSDGPGLIGNVVFGDCLGFNYVTALPLRAHSFTKAAFSQVVNAGDVFTGLVLCNPGHQMAEVTLSVYTPDGTRTGEETVHLETGRSLFQLLEELLPSTVGQVGGSIQLESTRPVLAYQSFGNYRLDFLSAAIPTVLH